MENYSKKSKIIHFFLLYSLSLKPSTTKSKPFIPRTFFVTFEEFIVYVYFVFFRKLFFYLSLSVFLFPFSLCNSFDRNLFPYNVLGFIFARFPRLLFLSSDFSYP